MYIEENNSIIFILNILMCVHLCMLNESSMWCVLSHFLCFSGRSYCITSHRMLMQCIDSLVQKVQSGVVINFEKIGPDPLPVTSEGKKTIQEIRCGCFFITCSFIIIYT